MGLWNVAGAFFNPNGIWFNQLIPAEWERLFFVHQTHALVFDEILTRIEHAKIFCAFWSNIFVILRREYVSFIVFSFNAQKSIAILHLLVLCIFGFFGTNPHGWIIWWIWKPDYVVHHQIFHLFINFVLVKRGQFVLFDIYRSIYYNFMCGYITYLTVHPVSETNRYIY